MNLHQRVQAQVPRQPQIPGSLLTQHTDHQQGGARPPVGGFTQHGRMHHEVFAQRRKAAHRHHVQQRLPGATDMIVNDGHNGRLVESGNVDALRGAGIFRTTDGVAWQQLASTNGENFQYVNRLAISKDGKVLLAATPKDFGRVLFLDRLPQQRPALFLDER